MDSKKKLLEDLKHLTEHVGLIHDNHGVIESLNRQKTETDTSMQKTLDGQIEEAEEILKTNREIVLKLLDEICELASQLDEKVFDACQKLDNDFKHHKDNPELLQIQKDIKEIQIRL